MDTAAVEREGSASRTFQSLFGAAAPEPHDENGELRGDARQQQQRIEEAAQGDAEDGGDDAEVWDDDFPSDVNMEEGEEDGGEGAGMAQIARKPRAKLLQAISAESRQSIEDWADNDDDEDNWRDALQARVDQLELVVEKKNEQLSEATRLSDFSDALASAAAVAARYGTPVDQRATLTLVPKTNLSRSVSAPSAAEQHRPASKLKTPNVVRSTTLSTENSSKAKGASASLRHDTEDAAEDPIPARKRSNSRDFLTRSTLATDHKRLTKATVAAPAAPSNSVFVRAVVARGSSNNGRTLETRIKDEAHVDKRAKSDDRAAMLALSDAEITRRHILNDVKKMSVERIVADAKRLHFLEDMYRRQPDASEAKRGVAASGVSARQSSPTKRRAA